MDFADEHTCDQGCKLPVHDRWLSVVNFLYWTAWAVWAAAATYTAAVRTALRDALSISGTPTDDALVWCFCPACALCQVGGCECLVLVGVAHHGTPSRTTQETRTVLQHTEHRAIMSDIENELSPLLEEDALKISLTVKADPIQPPVPINAHRGGV